MQEMRYEDLQKANRVECAVEDDPWKHRSSGMSCKTCMWFAKKPASLKLSAYDLGRCRRHAPTISGYPVVFVNDWCGDHKIDENKI